MCRRDRRRCTITPAALCYAAHAPCSEQLPQSSAPPTGRCPHLRSPGWYTAYCKGGWRKNHQKKKRMSEKDSRGGRRVHGGMGTLRASDAPWATTPGDRGGRAGGRAGEWEARQRRYLLSSFGKVHRRVPPEGRRSGGPLRTPLGREPTAATSLQLYTRTVMWRRMLSSAPAWGVDRYFCTAWPAEGPAV